jgi:CheY-like chemotaxis protein/HPt (histidine-containing phosphotransfer) domain-containing protein
LAGNGREAVNAISTIPYDVVFMDCQMPEMDGYEATAEIRRREQNTKGRHLPVIALTAHALEGDREKCLQAGMDDYLSKPFKQDQMVNILKRWLPGDDSAADEDQCEVSRDATESAAQLGETALPEPGAEPPQERREILSQNALNGIRSLSEGMLEKIVDLYLQESPKQLQGLKDAIGAEDAEKVQKVAHSFKSSSANLGAIELSEICKQLEMEARGKSLLKAPDLLVSIESEYAEVKQALMAETDC